MYPPPPLPDRQDEQHSGPAMLHPYQHTHGHGAPERASAEAGSREGRCQCQDRGSQEDHLYDSEW